MFYCELCMMLGDDRIRCHNCGNKKLREPKNNDPVYLLERNSIWSGGIEDVFEDNGIPCMKRGARGPALSFILGSGSETYLFYVPYADYDKAKELMADFLPEEGECESE